CTHTKPRKAAVNAVVQTRNLISDFAAPLHILDSKDSLGNVRYEPRVTIIYRVVNDLDVETIRVFSTHAYTRWQAFLKEVTHYEYLRAPDNAALTRRATAPPASRASRALVTPGILIFITLL